MAESQINIIRDRNREIMRRALTTRDIAHAINCTEKTARGLLRRGKIRSFRVGNDFRVLPEALDDFMQGKSA
jgi:excisionase family DNA binding protein